MNISPTGPLPAEFKSRDRILRTPKGGKSRNQDIAAEYQPHLGSRGQLLASLDEDSKPIDEKGITPEVKREFSAVVLGKTEERSEGDGDIGQGDCRPGSVEMAQYSPSQGRKMEYLLNQLSSNRSNTS